MQARERRAYRRIQLDALAKIMETPAGRSYIYDFLASCHVYSTSFGTNALMMAFKEGERNVGIRFGADLNEASPEMFFRMMKEAEDGRRNAADRNERTRGGDTAGFTEPDDDADDNTSG